jgi:Fe-S cluster assembly protein SufD
MVEMKQNAAGGQNQSYQGLFERLRNEIAQPEWLHSIRNAALSAFSKTGFPTLQDEDWRFTNVSSIAKLPLHQAPASSQLADGKSIVNLAFSKLSAIRLVFINGCYAPALSTPEAPKGLFVGSLAAGLASNLEWIQQHLGRYVKPDANAFDALNTAFFRDGALISVPANTILSSPIHLVFLSTAGQEGAVSLPRNLILVGANSHATILETYASLGQTSGLTNALTELAVGPGAVVEHCKYQEENDATFHMAALHALLEKGANVISHSIAIGAKLSRNNIRVSLVGEGAECLLNGLYLTREHQLADHHMVVEHAQPRCNSHEYFNGILDGHSRGVFHGRILVLQAAQKTDAKQTNKNLILSDEAGVNTKPQLEIYADDVKCTHGATIGQLSDESIFFLRARGIGLETARRMLIHAFAGEIVDRVRCLEARVELNHRVWARLETHPGVIAPQ